MQMIKKVWPMLLSLVLGSTVTLMVTRVYADTAAHNAATSSAAAQTSGQSAEKAAEKAAETAAEKMADKSADSAAASSHSAAASQNDPAFIKMIETRLGQGAKVDAVSKTPYSGLYEIKVNGDIAYVDEKADYLFMGNVIDLKTHQDMTKAKQDEMNRVVFADLPFNLAIKQVKGDGKRVIAIFEDPNCGYCKRFRKNLQSVNNLTVYTFMFNILAESSSVISRNVWCSPNKVKAWDDWMLGGTQAATAPANCTSPNNQVLELGKKLKITGTPTIFFVDGSRVPGAIENTDLETKLAEVTAKQ